MVIPALLLLQAAPTLDAIGPQALPKAGCAAFLWQTGSEPVLVAMATAGPAQLRISLDGRTVELPKAAQEARSGTGVLGFAPKADYAAGDIAATLEMTISADGVTDGARVTAGTLSIHRGGGDAVIVPLAGMVGCARGK